MEVPSAEKLIEMAKKDGVALSVEQAASILKFLTMLADIVVDSYLKNNKSCCSEEKDSS